MIYRRSARSQYSGQYSTVVYNHTYNTDRATFERTVPGYFYRQKPEWFAGKWFGLRQRNGKQPHPMMRKYMIRIRAPLDYIDGFRFDPNGHSRHRDNEWNPPRQSMPLILHIIYGEGWAAEISHSIRGSLAMKANTFRCVLPLFSTNCVMRLRGPFQWHKGLSSPKFRWKKALNSNCRTIQHPQVNNGFCELQQKLLGLPSRLKWSVTCPPPWYYIAWWTDLKLVFDITWRQLARLDKLAQTAVFT